MISTREIKNVKALSSKKFRDASGLFTVEGEKLVAEALESDFEVLQVWRRDEIGEEAMSRISALSTPSPVLAVLRQKPVAPPPPAQGLCLALDAIRDPGNLGTILRIADWFGVRTVFLSEDCVEPYNPKAIQASMGSIFRVRTVTADLPELCRLVRSAGEHVYGTFLDGRDLYREPLGAAGLVVMGNEAAGIRPAVAAEVDARLFIPAFGGSRAESLNVAAATAVTLSEFRRR